MIRLQRWEGTPDSLLGGMLGRNCGLSVKTLEYEKNVHLRSTVELAGELTPGVF